MKIGYLVVERFFPLDDFKRLTGFNHLEEIISIDHQLCSSCIKTYTEIDSQFIYKLDNFSDFDIFTNLDLLLDKFHGLDNKQILAIIREPDRDCKDVKINNFTFYGYDLIDEITRRSIITNGFGIYQDFFKNHISCYGLIEDFSKACTIKKRINLNNPTLNCKLWSIYRFE